jgi:hypothetical protein
MSELRKASIGFGVFFMIGAVFSNDLKSIIACSLLSGAIVVYGFMQKGR